MLCESHMESRSWLNWVEDNNALHNFDWMRRLVATHTHIAQPINWLDAAKHDHRIVWNDFHQLNGLKFNWFVLIVLAHLMAS